MSVGVIVLIVLAILLILAVLIGIFLMEGPLGVFEIIIELIFEGLS